MNNYPDEVKWLERIIRKIYFLKLNNNLIIKLILIIPKSKFYLKTELKSLIHQKTFKFTFELFCKLH